MGEGGSYTVGKSPYLSRLRWFIKDLSQGPRGLPPCTWRIIKLYPPISTFYTPTHMHARIYTPHIYTNSLLLGSYNAIGPSSWLKSKTTNNKNLLSNRNLRAFTLSSALVTINGAAKTIWNFTSWILPTNPLWWEIGKLWEW